MKGKAHVFRILFSIQNKKLDSCNYHHIHIINPYISAHFLSTTTISAATSSPDLVQRVHEVVEGETTGPPKDAAEVLRKWGCSETDLSNIFNRQPSLRNALVTHLESKLEILREVGLSSSDLVKMINCRPRFLSCRLNKCLDERLRDLQSLFGSRQVLLRAIVRNPSLLVYDFGKTVEPVVSLYKQLGVNKEDLVSMLMMRPTVIPRTRMSKEKLDYIRRTGALKESKMYKYVATIIGVSRIETIREKVANLEKFGFSEDEVLKLFGRSPLLMTLSVEKVQRNMTFVMGMLNMPAKSVAEFPFLLFASLDDVLKPRGLLAGKIDEMGLNPKMKGRMMLTALRMSEKRFLKAFVMCHQGDVRDELLEYYRYAKGIKRLAKSAKKVSFANGFPF